jgi:hypothetical protein
MTITPSADSRRVVVAFARLALESFTADRTRENIAALLPLWHGYAIMTDDERADVLAAYPPAPQPSPDVLAKDVWADIQADSKRIVDEMLAEDLAAPKKAFAEPEPREVPKRAQWSAFGACPKCGVGVGVQCVFTEPHSSAGELRPIAHRGRPLSEVTARPTGEVWDDSVPPGGFVCAVCRIPVESEPCPEHGPKAGE